MKNTFRSHYLLVLAISINVVRIHAHEAHTTRHSALLLELLTQPLNTFARTTVPSRSAQTNFQEDPQIPMLAKSLAKEKAKNNLLAKKLEVARRDYNTASASWRSCDKALQQSKEECAELEAKNRRQQFYIVGSAALASALTSAAWNHQAIATWFSRS